MRSGFDAHTHLDFPALDADRDAVIARARAAGVDGFAIAGADPRHWDRVLRVADAIGAVATLGLHPWWVEETDDLDAVLAGLAARLTVHGLGETGLDWIRARDEGARDRQRDALRRQLALARERDVPVVLHCVRAYDPLLAILGRDGLPAAGGMIHSFSGAPTHAERAVALGLHVSFGTLVVKPHATRVREAACRVPGDRLLLETDCPDQPLPGETRGEPADLRQVAEAVAALRGEEVEEVLARAGDRARELLRARGGSRSGR